MAPVFSVDTARTFAGAEAGLQVVRLVFEIYELQLLHGPSDLHPGLIPAQALRARTKLAA